MGVPPEVAGCRRENGRDYGDGADGVNQEPVTPVLPMHRLAAALHQAFDPVPSATVALAPRLAAPGQPTLAFRRDRRAENTLRVFLEALCCRQEGSPHEAVPELAVAP